MTTGPCRAQIERPALERAPKRTRFAMKLPPHVFHTSLAAVLLVTVLWCLPAATDLWRKVMVGIFSVSLGYHIVTAIMSPVSKGRVWLECLAFPMLMLGILSVPAAMGWVLLASGMLWRALIRRLL